WTPEETESALHRVREAMASATGLLPVAEAAARTIHVLMEAWETTATLVDGPDYWDIVHITDDPDDDYPPYPDLHYALDGYPIGTERMLSGRGYVSGSAVDEVMVEFERQWPDVPAGSIMSVPIIAMGQVHGEFFMVRHYDVPPFTRDDLDVGAELATLFGARLPALVTAYFESQGEQTGSASLPNLTRELDEPID
ncbi:MAG TPA: hypothetical protein VFX15_15370, partial [Actinomycetes bacterium]|nr:hypothetical protein [Actinomycetes bacterium]